MLQVSNKFVLFFFVFKLFWKGCKKILTIIFCKLIGKFFTSIDNKNS